MAKGGGGTAGAAGTAGAEAGGGVHNPSNRLPPGTLAEPRRSLIIPSFKPFRFSRVCRQMSRAVLVFVWFAVLLVVRVFPSFKRCKSAERGC